MMILSSFFPNSVDNGLMNKHSKSTIAKVHTRPLSILMYKTVLKYPIFVHMYLASAWPWSVKNGIWQTY